MTLKSCEHCRIDYSPPEDPDPCLGMLDGVLYACCGHGQAHPCYVIADIGADNKQVFEEFIVKLDQAGLTTPETQRRVQYYRALDDWNLWLFQLYLRVHEGAPR